MPLDLKIVQSGLNGSLLGGTWPNPDYVDGEYNLVQRIYKNLLTKPGDDMFDPDWGSALRERVQGIPGQNVNKARAAVVSALKKCADDIISSLVSNDPAERLRDLGLDTIEYDVTRAAWICAVSVTTDATEITISVSA